MDGYNYITDANRGIGIRIQKSSCTSLEAQLVLNPNHASLAFRLRYNAYRSRDFIPTRTDHLFFDSYDKQINFQTILIFKYGIEAATARISVFDPNNTDSNQNKLQAMEIFNDEIEATISAHRLNDKYPRVIEIAKLARSLAFAKDIDPIFGAYRAAGYLILHHNIDIVFSGVRTHHIPIYRRFGFQQLTAPREYPGLAFRTSLMACFRPNFAEARENLPFLRGISTDDACYAGLIAGERVSLSAPSPETASPETATPDGGQPDKTSPRLAA
ncbi:MAG TPA: hypothetical protein VF286_09290 [Acidiphilium sp.]